MTLFRYTFIYIVLFCLSLGAQAQRKQIGEARSILKSGKNFDKAEQLMTNLLKDSANRDNKRIYEIWFESVQKQYEQANERFYMKKEQDTAQFFSLVRRMFTVAECLDSIDARPDKKGRVEPELRKSLSRDMMTYRSNLFFGGAFHVRKGNFTTSFDYFEAYIDCARQPLFSDYRLDETDNRLAEAAYWAGYSGYRLGDAVLALRYQKLALRDSLKAENTLQYAAEAWHWLKDDSMYIATLDQGFRRYPQSPYFFPRLMDAYTRNRQLEKALDAASYGLQCDSLNQLFLLAKSTALLNLERYQESLTYSQKLIAVNDSSADAYMNAGTACLNIALTIPASNKKEVRKIYQQARPFLERYRQLAPDDKQKWGPALYRVYFNLNMGKQFDEIDKILNK